MESYLLLNTLYNIVRYVQYPSNKKKNPKKLQQTFQKVNYQQTKTKTVSVSQTMIFQIPHIKQYTYSKGFDAVDRPSNDHENTATRIQNILRGTKTKSNHEFQTETISFIKAKMVLLPKVKKNYL